MGAALLIPLNLPHNRAMKKSKGSKGKGGKRCVSGFGSDKIAQRGIPLPKSIKFYSAK